LTPVNRQDVPFFAALPRFSRPALVSVIFERRFMRIYKTSDRVLFTIGLVFLSVAAVDYTMGSQQQFSLPETLQPVPMSLVSALANTACSSSYLRIDDCASVHSCAHSFRQPPAAAVMTPVAQDGHHQCGFHYSRLVRAWRVSAARWVPDSRPRPLFPLKFMIYFLIVVTVGGTSSHRRVSCLTSLGIATLPVNMCRNWLRDLWS
jgi:branched-chain amino acid transport system permease protein